LSLRLLVDEDTQANRLIALLQTAGHDVVTVAEAGLKAQADLIVLDYARREGRILLTRNCDEFRFRHEANPQHAGIFAICRGKNSSEDMSRDEIVKALGNLDASGLEFAGQFVSVNAWKY
jgi:predicted nuclease of predicted toxin-antitoxin system